MKIGFKPKYFPILLGKTERILIIISGKSLRRMLVKGNKHENQTTNYDIPILTAKPSNTFFLKNYGIRNLNSFFNKTKDL